MSVLTLDAVEASSSYSPKSLGSLLSPQSPQSSKFSQRSSGSIDDFDGFEWPELVGLEDLLLDSSHLSPDLKNHKCPPELHQIPSDIPDDLARIIRHSVNIDPSTRSNKEEVNEQAGERGQSQDEVTTPTRTASSPGQSATEKTSSFDLSKQSTAGCDDAPTRMFSHFSFSTSSGNNSVSTRTQSKRSAFGRLSLRSSNTSISVKSRMKERFTFRECSSCVDEVMEKNLLVLECGHKYCLSCFLNMVDTAMKDESKFPPKCCLVEIPMKMILHNVDRAKRDAYKLKMKEFSIKEDHRWYCPWSSCKERWIPSNKIKNGAKMQRCPHCRKLICGTCRGRSHMAFEICPGMYHLKGRTSSVESHAYRTCHRCQSKIKLVTGNDHTVCECGEVFCCICGARQGMCDCLEVEKGPPSALADGKFLGASSIDELAATIVQIERVEKGKAEAQERLESEQRIQEEKDRLREEQERRQAQEKETERLVLVANKLRELRTMLVKINEEQQSSLTARHQASAQSIQIRCADEQADYEQWRARLQHAYRSNLRYRKTAQATAQSAELLQLKAHHEDEEDETFVNTQRYLRGKPNREEREQSILKKLRRAHERERVALEKAQREATKELDFETNMEGIALQAGISKKLQVIHNETSRSLYDLTTTVLADRRWYIAVMARRFQLLKEYRTSLINGHGHVRDEVKASSDHSTSEDEKELDILHEEKIIEHLAAAPPPLFEHPIHRLHDTAELVEESPRRKSKDSNKWARRSPFVMLVN